MVRNEFWAAVDESRRRPHLGGSAIRRSVDARRDSQIHGIVERAIGRHAFASGVGAVKVVVRSRLAMWGARPRAWIDQIGGGNS